MQLSTTTQSTKGKKEFFLHLDQASSTRQVLEAKKNYVSKIPIVN